MDPATIGAMVATLAASEAGRLAMEKAAGKVGEKTAESGWGLGAMILERVRAWFDDDDQVSGIAALEAVEVKGDTDNKATDELATIVESQLKLRLSVARDLSGWLENALQDPTLARVLNNVYVEGLNQAGKVNSSEVKGCDNIAIQDVGRDVTVRRDIH